MAAEAHGALMDLDDPRETVSGRKREIASAAFAHAAEEPRVGLMVP